MEFDRMSRAEQAFLEMAKFCLLENLRADVVWTKSLVLKFEGRNEEDEICLIATIGPERDGLLNVEDFVGKPLFNLKMTQKLSEILVKMGFIKKEL